jgi:hypothetical protein
MLGRSTTVSSAMSTGEIEDMADVGTYSVLYYNQNPTSLNCSIYSMYCG